MVTRVTATMGFSPAGGLDLHMCTHMIYHCHCFILSEPCNEPYMSSALTHHMSHDINPPLLLN